MKAAIALVACLSVAPALADGDVGFSKGEHFDERGGEALYRSICQGCHMPDARGATGAGTYPSLAANARLSSAAYASIVVLGGRRNMPAFAASLDDEQVAAVVTYVRSHFANDYRDAVTAEQVAALRPPK